VKAGLIDKPEFELTFDDVDSPAYYESLRHLDVVDKAARQLSYGAEPLYSELKSVGLIGFTNALLTWVPGGTALFRTYVNNVVKNSLVDHMRKEGRWSNEVPKSDVLEDINASEYEDPDVLTLKKEEHERFWSVLDDMFPNLNDLERGIILFRLLDQKPLTYRTLAERYKVSAMWVWKKEVRLKNIIREELENGIS
jgi:RNA polymerase sigma factor (sigma-70 family)